MTEGNRIDSFENLECPPDNVTYKKLKSIMATNVVDTVMNALEILASFEDHNVDMESGNILTMRIQDPSSNISYTIDADFDKPHDLSFSLLWSTFIVQIYIDIW